jgi:hypothetical protein
MRTDRSEPAAEGVTALYQTPPPMHHGDEIVMKKSSKKGGMQKLIKSAFKRGETSSKDAPFGDPYGKPPSGQAKTRKNRNSPSEDSGSWDSDSTESFEGIFFFFFWPLLNL